MTKKTSKRKASRQDATIRNVRAANTRIKKLEKQMSSVNKVIDSMLDLITDLMADVKMLKADMFIK